MKTIILILSVFVLMSCSSSLTREKAGEVIKAQLPLPLTLFGAIPKVHTIGTGFLTSDPLDKSAKRFESTIQAMETQNLITFVVTNNNDFYEGYRRYKINLTSEGEKYLVGSDGSNFYVKLFDVDLTGVTGLLEYEQPKKYVEVNYTIQSINKSPFLNFNLEIDNSLKKYLNPQQIINIAKFDDGWRIEKPSTSTQ
jgi:hypothetical protein